MMLDNLELLDHLGHPEAADHITDAITAILARTAVRTPDLSGTAATGKFANALLEHL